MKVFWRLVIYAVTGLAVGHLLGWVVYGAPATPTITYTAANEFQVRFAPGAGWACVYFQEQRVREEDRQNFPDGKYQPHKCGSLDATSTYFEVNWDYIKPYDSDWLVWASVGYQQTNGDFVYVDSSKLRVHR